MKKSAFFTILAIALISLSACDQSVIDTGQQTVIARSITPYQTPAQLATLQPSAKVQGLTSVDSSKAVTIIASPTVTNRPIPSPTTANPIYTESAALSPVPSPTAPPEGFMSGYWIQNTEENGLCSNTVRFISPASLHETDILATRGQQVCQLGRLPVEEWLSCGPDPFFGFPGWQSSSLSGLKVVKSSAAFEQGGCDYNRPGLAGSGGRCIAKDYSGSDEIGFECQSEVDGLPFDDVVGYAIDEDDVEWFLSPQALASLGRKPKERTWQLPTIVEDPKACFTVLSLSEDRLIAGTNGSGLLVFDPGQEKTRRITNLDGLPGDEIRWIQDNGEDCLLVATDNGVGLFNGKKWQSFDVKDGLPTNDVLAITTQDPGNCSILWAATTAGPARWQQDSPLWQTFPDFPKDWDLSGARFNEFTTNGQGVLKFIPAPLETGAQTQYTIADGLPGEQITALAQGEAGILVGTTAGAAVWDGSRWSTVTTSTVNSVSSNMIAASDGVWTFQVGDWKMISQEPVQAIAEGGWYATNDKICRLTALQPVCPNREDGNPLSGTLVMDSSPEGEVWVIDDQKHVWQLDPNGEKPDQFVNAHFEFLYGPMKALLAAPDGPFFGSNAGFYSTMPFGDGEMRVSRAEYTLGDGFRVRVRDLAYEPVNDRIWLATNQGIFYAQRTELLEHGYGPSVWTALAYLPTRDFTAVLPLADGSAWLGTADQGLIHFVP